MSHWAIKNYVIPFLKRIKRSRFFCSFKDGFNDSINISSRYVHSLFRGVEQYFPGKNMIDVCLNALLAQNLQQHYHVLTTLLWCFFLLRQCNLLHICKSHSKFYMLGIIFILQTKQSLYFPCFSTNWNTKTIFCKMMEFFQKML